MLAYDRYVVAAGLTHLESFIVQKRYPLELLVLVLLNEYEQSPSTLASLTLSLALPLALHLAFAVMRVHYFNCSVSIVFYSVAILV